MKSFSARTFAILACLHLMGGHWLALQSVAWVGMFVEYQRDVPLAEALGKTFDGEELCALCQVVQKGQQEDSGSREWIELGGLNHAILAGAVRLPRRSSVDVDFFEREQALSSLSLPLASPPPRRA